MISSITFVLSITSLFGYDLKSNMILLNTELGEVQRNLIKSNDAGAKRSILRFAKHANELLGNEKKFQKLLPENKKHNANEAVMSAHIIAHNVQIVLDALDNRYKQPLRVRREEAQRAYTYIEHACFRCHNEVRDKK